MADEIIQVLGFDATNTVSAINEVNKALDDLNGRLGATVRQMDGFNKKAGKVVGALKKITGATGTPVQAVNNLSNASKKATQSAQTFSQRAGAAYKQFGDKSASILGGAVINFQTFTRVISTQAIVRALNALQNAFSESFSSAIDFSKQAAEIATIAGSDFGGIGNIASQVRELSDAFNQSLGDVGEGLYQTISNQIGDASESIEFLTAALKFSKVAVASTEDSVNLLAGTINAFGLNASDTEDIAAKFFRTIELGRVRASELANTLGRVAPRAAQLGVSLDEVNASIVDLTISGLKPAEALTQLRGIFTALTKESPALSKGLKELGFANVEVGVATLGFAGLLKELTAGTDGTAKAISELFRRERGLAGVTRLARDEAVALEKAVTAMGETTREVLDEKLDIIFNTNAEEVTRQANKLKNAFTVDVGEALVNAVAGFTRLTGGADTLIPVLQGVVATGGIAAATIGVLGAAMLLSAGQTRLATVELSRFSKVLGSIGLAVVAVAAGNTIASFVNEAIQDGVDKLRKANDEATKEAINNRKDQSKAALESLDVITKATLESVRKQSKAFGERDAAFTRSEERIVQSARDSLSRVVDIRSDILKELQRASSQGTDQIAESQERVLDAQERLRDRQFDQQVSPLNDTQKVFALQQRASDLAREAAQALRQAVATGDDAGISRALRQLDRAEQVSEESEAVAKLTGNRVLENNTAEGTNSIIRGRIALEKQVQKLTADRVKKADEAAKAETANVQALKDIQKRIEQNLNFRDKDGKLIDEATRKLQAQKIREDLDKFIDRAIDPGKISLSDALGIQEAGDRLRKLFEQDLPFQEGIQIVGNLEGLEAQLADIKKDLRAELPVTVQVEGLGFAINNINDLAQAIVNMKKEAEGFIAAENEADANALKLFNRFTDINNSVNRLASDVVKIPTDAPILDALVSDNVAIQEGLQDIVNLVRQVTSDSQVTQQEFNEVAKAVADFKTEFDSFADGQAKIQFASLQDLVNSLKLAKQLNVKQIGLDAATDPTRLEKIQQALNGQALAEILSSSADNVSSTMQAGAQTAGQSLAAPLNAALDRAQNTQIQVQQPQPTGSRFGGGFAKGGLVQRFASGGFAKGTDTIPAMLSPGEFVVNARSTRKFYSQLKSMNAGVKPIFRQEGGEVPGATTNIGDINVTVSGSRRTEQEAREIAKTIRREIRRGTTQTF